MIASDPPAALWRRITGATLLIGTMAVSATVAVVLSAALWWGARDAERAQLAQITSRYLDILRDGGLGGLTQAIDGLERSPDHAESAYEVAVWRGRPGDWTLHRASRPDLAPALLEAAGAGASLRRPGRSYLVAAPDVARISQDWDLPANDLALRLALKTPGPQTIAARRLILAVWGGFGMALAVGLLLHLDNRRRYAASVRRIADDLDRFSSGDTALRMGASGMAPELRLLAARLNRVLDRIEDLIGGLRHLAAHAAHEMKTPLQRVLTDLGPLERAGDEAARRDAVHSIQATVFEARHRLDSLMQLFRLQAGVAAARPAPIDLSTLVDRVAEDHVDALDQRALRFAWDIAPGVRVRGDRHLMSLLLDNLLGNAAKYAPGGARVRLDLRSTGTAFELSVLNTGGAFAPDIRGSAFRRFTRAESAGDAPGAGLGLSLVAAIAEWHGFAVRITPSDEIAEVVLSGPCETAATGVKP